MITELRHHHLKVPEANAFENCGSEGQRKSHAALDCCAAPSGPVLPLPSPSVSHLIRERAAVRLLIYLMKIRFGMALIKTSWLSPAVALHGGNCSEALCVWGCHGWHRSKWHFFNKYI